MSVEDECDNDLATVILSLEGSIFAVVERTAIELTLRPAELIRRVVVAAFAPPGEVSP